MELEEPPNPSLKGTGKSLRISNGSIFPLFVYFS
jgi:hypothetical protein